MGHLRGGSDDLALAADGEFTGGVAEEGTADWAAGGAISRAGGGGECIITKGGGDDG